MLQAVEWRIAGVCNLRCVYCYGPEHSISPADDEVAAILNALVKCPAPIIRFSGGEPLIVPNISEIIRILHESGKSVVLSTNGVRFAQLRDQLDPYISKLNLSIDGYDSATHAVNGRTPNSFNIALAVLDGLIDRPAPYIVKVGTVLTARNIGIKGLLPEMYRMLISRPVDRWKIYQYIPEGPIVDQTLRVSDELFRYIEETSRREMPAKEGRVLDINFASAQSRNAAYFLIQPNGDVLVPLGDSSATEERLIGNIITDDFNELERTWNSLSSHDNHLRNISLGSINRSIDDVDKRIMFKIDQDPTIEIPALAKAVNTSEDEVKRRTQWLFDTGVIRYSMPIVNLEKLGFAVYLFEVQAKIGASDVAVIREFTGHPNVGWFVSVLEQGTFMGALFVISVMQCYEVIAQIASNLADYIDRIEVSSVYEKYILGQRYLTIQERVTDFVFDNSRVTFTGSPLDILSSLDRSVLTSLREFRSTSLSSVAEAASLQRSEVEGVIEDLTKRNIIVKFQPVYNVQKLGYRWFVISLKLAWMSSRQRAEMIDYLHSLTRVVHINCMLGSWHMNFEIHTVDPNECQRILDELNSVFVGIVTDFSIRELGEEHKFNFLTDAVIEAANESVSAR